MLRRRGKGTREEDAEQGLSDGGAPGGASGDETLKSAPEVLVAERQGPKLGEWLVAEGLVSEEALEEALQEQESAERPLGEILVRRGHVEPRVISEGVGAQYGIPVIDLRAISPEN